LHSHFDFSAGIFAIPDYLNKEVVQLLCMMLQVDPLKRATIKDIKDHDWFKKDLPGYLFPSPNDHDASIVDLEVIREICDVRNIFFEEITDMCKSCMKNKRGRFAMCVKLS
jgi:5'-AMP-activated protein kinase catalytic alpha subunit